MKNSGVEWIGKIPYDWQLMTIGSLFHVRNEKVSDTEYAPLSVSRGGVVPQMENVAKTDANDNRKLVLKGDFAINSRSDRKQSCGVSPLDGSVSLINTVLYVADDAPIISDYPNLLMKNYGFAEEFYRWGHGIVADLWTTRWQEMKSIVLPIPPKPEQTKVREKIVIETKKVDALITNQEAQIEKLKAYKQSLITETVTKGLDPTVPMKDSGVEWIGKIPEHWGIIKAKYVSSISHGTDPKTEGDTPVYGSGAESFKTCGEYKEGPAVLVGRKGATLHIPHFIEGRYWNVDTAFDVKMIQEKMLLRYYYYLSFCFDYKYYISQTTLPGMTQNSYQNMSLPFPGIGEQQQIIDWIIFNVRKVDRLIAIKQEKIDKLNEYKKSLIYEYVTGKKEVV